MSDRYRVVMSHPDDPVQIYDLHQPDEPCVVTCANADEADAWIQDHPDVTQLVAALVDPDRKGDWFHAGAESFGPAHSASHHAMSNVAHAVCAMMLESGFPLQTFMAMLRNQVVDIDHQTKERLSKERSIGRLGAWRDDA